MSAETKAALLTAIAEHFASERDGATLTGYIITIKGKTIENLDRGFTSYLVDTPDDQDYDTALGLAQFGVLQITEGFSQDSD